MPLSRGSPLGYDTERMAFKFTMLNGDEMLECQIGGAAMDELAGGKGTPPTVLVPPRANRAHCIRHFRRKDGA